MYSSYTILNMIDDKLIISQLLLNIIAGFYEKDAKVNYFDTDTLLYHSEIHMVQFIKENQALHLSAIARGLGITRGAVSQMIMRLEKKGVVSKEPDPGNNRKVILRLTSKGEKAYLGHKRNHDSYNAVVSTLLENASQSEMDFLKEFLMKYEKALHKTSSE
ncbi:transcriptional regulator, MarR family [Dendrosporobacter quercicolus]|uniref:Transcriptional regulator, MarR family n=1 Tax=Dendrosporobacter quercicolus TaxID=146817 RepID=A0A1G9NM40_9FIRM|nr:transcriptional regulator, MarR family [Dendrosporobacter quercicolus]